jgi:DNA-binding response OmpR family regulator
MFANAQKSPSFTFETVNSMRVAVLEDDPIQLQHLVHTLTYQLVIGEEAVTCTSFEQGKALRRSLRQETFDLLVLDWNVPDLDGIELLQWLRNYQKNEVPVLILSSRSAERDVTRALSIGADDYVSKPFRAMELCARVRRLLVRRGTVAGDADRFDGWAFDRLTCSVTITLPDAEPQTVTLTDREFRLALALFRHMGKLVSRSYLLERVGQDGDEALSRSLDSHIYRLRNKLGLHSPRGLRLLTVYGQGYRLEVTDSAPSIPAAQQHASSR